MGSNHKSSPPVNGRSLAYLITALPPSASLGDALKAHWREYLMEAADLCVLMVCICLSGALIYSVESPLQRLSISSAEKALLMGVAVATASFLIICSPFGRRTGAHLNPSLTIAYLWLGRAHRWDALFYVIAQFAGAMVGVLFAGQMLGHFLSAPPVHYVVTLPGRYGNPIAFIGEFLLAGMLMGIILYSTNHRRLTRFSPLFVALITVFYYVLCPSISGFSVNPARTFSSAFFAWIWQGVWIYFAAPTLGMLAAAAIYVRSMGSQKVYCAKVFHDTHSICPFPCRFHELFDTPEQ